MKKLKFICAAFLSVLMLGACSDDKLVDGPKEPDSGSTGSVEDGVFFSLNIKMPSAAPGGRSMTGVPGDNGSTSQDGVEIGKDYENTVSEAIVVLAEAENNNFIAAASINSGDLKSNDANKSTYTANSKFSKTVLQAYYNGLPESAPKDMIKANIFLFCNPTQELRDAIFGFNGTGGAKVNNNDWVNASGSVDQSSPIWASNYFLMSNALIETRAIPAKFEDWNYYTNESKPFNLSGNNTDVTIDNLQLGGAIKVERTSARFDFRDASEKGDFKYHVIYTGVNDNSVENTPIIDIELQRMALVNMGKKFYFLPHMVNPADGSNGEYAVAVGADVADDVLKGGICIPEQPWAYNAQGGINTPYGNYVLDVDYRWKNDMIGKTEGYDFSNNLIYPFFNEDGTIDNTNASSDRWYTSLCADVVKGENDNPDSWNAGGSKGTYHIWRYGTENTVPSIKGQVNGISTGVVFKGKMVATDEALSSEDENVRKLAETVNNVGNKLNDSYKDPIIYQYAGNLYLSWTGIREAAINAADPQFKWVIVSEEPEGGRWELVSINRTASLYKAVFGTGGCGTIKFKFNQEGTDVKGEAEFEDVLDRDEESADYLWDAWSAAGKPNESAESTKAFKVAVTAADITIYQSSNDAKFGWGYYCYYYYWNRHNSNGNTGVMGPMEFAVVRNNVYKLAVTKISKLGHPRISANDPDKPEPGTPDESEDVYLTVDAQVLPWVVRVNDIEF